MQKILIIEDDNDAFYLVKNFLQDIGYDKRQITRCTHLAEVLALPDNFASLVLADLGLPDSPSGMTFRKIQEKFPYTPILVLTGSGQISQAVETIKLGAQDYLIKGDFNRKDLDRAIKYAIERKKVRNDYERLFRENPAPMYIYEEHTFRFLAVNNAAVTQYGYTQDKFLQLHATEIRPAEEKEAFKVANKNLTERYGDFGRWRHIKKNGEIFHVQIFGHTTVFDGKAAVIILALDVEKEVSAEKTLIRKNREIQNILESITDGFYIVDNNWTITYFNKEAERILGEPRSEVVGKNIWSHFPQVVEGKIFEYYNRAMQEKISLHFEEYYPPRDIWTHIRVYPRSEGLAVYFIDITEQKKIEARLLNEEQNLRAIINNTKDIIWSIDRNLNIISANDAFWERLRRITGKEISDVDAADFSTLLYSAWKEYFDRAFGGEAFTIIRTVEQEGKTLFEEISFNPIFDELGNTTGASCFSRDVTQQNQHLAMIEKQNEQLRNIAWIQSHEVRSPVASILGLVELVNAESYNDPAIADLLRKIKEAAVDLDTVIRKITAHAST